MCACRGAVAPAGVWPAVHGPAPMPDGYKLQAVLDTWVPSWMLQATETGDFHAVLSEGRHPGALHDKRYKQWPKIIFHCEKLRW